MEIPDAVKWLLPIVVGQSWPEGDETKLRALAEAWHTASGAIAPAQEAGAKASDTILQNWTGQGADAYREQWKKFVEGDEAYFKQLADASKTQESAVSGAVAGVVGAASGSIVKGATESLSHSAAGQIADSAMRAGARGAVEGVAQTVGQAAVTGKLGELTPEQLLMGASGGAVGGAVGGAKESIHAIG